MVSITDFDNPDKKMIYKGKQRKTFNLAALFSHSVKIT